MSGIQAVGRSSFAVRGAFVRGRGTVVGQKERAGPLGDRFDEVWDDALAGQKSFEAAERELVLAALDGARRRAGWEAEAVDLCLGGDLLNQLYSTNFAARSHQIPFVGLFSACATFTEAVGLGALLVAAGGPERVLAVTASHHLAAERQFRYPVELGYQRAPTASWTATAAGAVALGADPAPVAVRGVTVGRVVDAGRKDPMDMGTAMAPAAYDTIRRHLAAFDRRPADYDRILTGDLGRVGSPVLTELLEPEAPGFGDVHEDCGRLMYRADQDVHNGGSGAGLASAVFCAWALPELEAGRWRRVLLVATGALFSPTSYQQGESIPCVAHAVEFEREEGNGR
ncbi:MAG: stage V sporulation protein AD [Actinomycetia bacterium]|nr:stage V sporulation protein AD [Actinomycetes bacterium]